MKLHSAFATLPVLAILAACNSQPEAPRGSFSLPAWIANPTIEDGIAASSCVRWSGHLDIDQRQVLAIARQQLAQQIDLRVKSMDETYARRTQAAGGDAVGGVFESVSRQVTEQNLHASIPERIETFSIAGEDNLCAMVTMRPEATRQLFEQLVQASGVSLGARDEAVLYEEFKAHQAQQRMDEELARP